MDHTPYPPDDLKPNSSKNPFLPDIGSNKKQKYKQDEISLNEIGADELEERDDLDDDELPKAGANQNQDLSPFMNSLSPS